MDERRFRSRPMKVKKNTIVDEKAWITTAACREESNLNHMSLVAAINLFGQRMKSV
jgi:hypothetical protein